MAASGDFSTPFAKLLGFLNLRQQQRASASRKLFADQYWCIDLQNARGDVFQEVVKINGGNLLTDINLLARAALKDPNDRAYATILRATVHFPMQPAIAEALHNQRQAEAARLQFDRESG